jgi:hypothetical protein
MAMRGDAGLSMTRYFHLLREERDGPIKSKHTFAGVAKKEYWSMTTPQCSFGDYGPGPQSFRMLRQVAFDEHSRVWCVDSCNNRVHIRDPCTGQLLSMWPVEKNTLLSPTGLAVARLGSSSVFICDERHGPRVCEYDRASGMLRRQLIPSVDVNTAFSACSLSPNEKLLAVTDTSMHRIHVFSLIGRPPLVFGKQGFHDGHFMFPSDVCFSSDGDNILVADRENHRLQIFELDGTFVRQIKLASHADCVVCNFDGILTVDDSGLRMFSMAGDCMHSQLGGLSLRYSKVSGLAVDLNDGKIAVADELNSQVHIV